MAIPSRGSVRTRPVRPGGGGIDMEWDEPGPVAIPPGVYCGKFTLKNATEAVLTPDASGAVWVFKGGPMNIEGDSILRGTGVTLYFTEGGGYDFEPFSFSSNAVADLSAPDTCTTPATLPNGCQEPLYGMLFWADPNAGDPDDEFRFESNTGEHLLTGTIYMPNHIFNVESSAYINSADTWLNIIVRRFIAESNSLIEIGTNYSGGGNNLKTLALVE